MKNPAKALQPAADLLRPCSLWLQQVMSQSAGDGKQAHFPAMTFWVTHWQKAVLPASPRLITGHAAQMPCLQGQLILICRQRPSKESGRGSARPGHSGTALVSIVPMQ